MNEANVPTECDALAATTQCPNCGSSSLKHETVLNRFPYGAGKDAPQLTALIPVSRCLSCGLEFSGEEAERARDEAIRRHLGLLTPHRIAEVRGRYDLPRATFAEISRIGLATLVRWETGETVQNRAMDLYMRLLERPEIFNLVATGAIFEGDSRKPRGGPLFPTLERSLNNSAGMMEKAERGKAFSLVPIAA